MIILNISKLMITCQILGLWPISILLSLITAEMWLWRRLQQLQFEDA